MVTASRQASSVTIKHVIAVAAVIAVASCGRAAVSPSTPLGINPVEGLHHATTSPITHVVFIIQENRSFNNLFMGYPGATTQNYGYNTYGQKIALQPIDLATAWDIDHSSTAFFAACDGTGKLPGTDCKMDGWNKEVMTLHAPTNGQYGYVPRSEIKPYWKMAQQYVLSDNTYASNLDASFVAHQYIVAAYADRTVNGPDGPWGCEGGQTDMTPTLTKHRKIGKSIVTCFDIPSIATEADAAGVSWRFYAAGIYDDGGIWSSYQAESKIYDGPDWTTDVIDPPAQFLTDVGNGELANVTWITPTYQTSDHDGMGASGGPAWVASVVDAVGKSKFWNSTAIFLFWDDWGGWFDPVKPIYEDYDGLGFRVPLIMISPYAKEGYVTHVQYETSSVLRYIEDNFGLAPLAKSDMRANDPADDAFDYSQEPRKFKKIPGAKPPSYWLRLESSRSRRAVHILGDD
jgi:phospholipase C